MANLKDVNKKQNDNIKEDTDNFLYNQRELIENITLNIQKFFSFLNNFLPLLFYSKKLLVV
jgi:hypothetical protein